MNSETLVLDVAHLHAPPKHLDNARVLIQGGVVQRFGLRAEIEAPTPARVLDCTEQSLAPAFVDTHVHGHAGHDVMEANDKAFGEICASLAQHGTLFFCPTTASASREETLRAVRYLGDAIRRFEHGEFPHQREKILAQPVGIHLEGPFLSERKRGTHPREHLIAPSKEWFNELMEASDERIELITIAPELEGALDLITYARELDIKVGIGHSNATFEETERAIRAGATHATHLFNAMREFHQREPGIVGAALIDPRLSCEIIADGVHVHPALVHLLFTQKGFERVLTITDATSATAMPDGQYRLGEFAIEVREGICRNAEGALAGSTLTQSRAVANLMAWKCGDLSQLLTTASYNPARLLGEENRFGSIQENALARFALLDASGKFLKPLSF